MFSLLPNSVLRFAVSIAWLILAQEIELEDPKVTGLCSVLQVLINFCNVIFKIGVHSLAYEQVIYILLN